MSEGFEPLAGVIPDLTAKPTFQLDETLAADPESVTLQEAPAPPKYDPHADWDRLVGVLREGMMQQLAKRKSPVTNPIPHKPLDSYGRPLVYAKDKNNQPRYAYDAHGRLSLGPLTRKKGRIKPHFTKRGLAIKDLAIAEFRRLFSASSAELQAAAEKVGREYEGVPVHVMGKISAEAIREATRQYKVKRRSLHRQRRLRQSVSRRINFGLIPGNHDRRAHASF